ncbi:MAG: lysylphosphatidylglycerol synthase domain-containing protein [Candidatus Moduliflexus flocculans]|nr:lysylphosphatidylglycerol synthase domain-containing protein [Candidatus Moduliflexus flocculans]
MVTGYAGEAVERHLAAKAAADGLSVAIVRNDEWEKENGLSVSKAAGLTGDKFFLMMADHIVDPGLLAGLGGCEIGGDEVILAVDTRIEGHPQVDLDDVTRVREEAGRIAAIGKNIPDFNAFDTGVFLCTPALFEALAESQRRGDLSLSGGIRVLAAKGKARAKGIGDRFWIDVDDEAALRKAEAAIAGGLTGSQSGAGSSRSVWRPSRLLLGGAGFLLLAYLVLKIGLGTVLSQLARFGPWFLATIAVAFAWLFVQACAWGLVQAAHFRPVPLLRLFRAKIISDSLNALIPSASLGGDAARAFLIRRHVPLTEGIPGVLVDKTIEFSSGVLFLVTGFLLSLLFVDLPRWMNVAAAVCLGGSVVGVVLLILFQRKGTFWALGRVAKVVPEVGRFAARREAGIRQLDRNLRLVYANIDARTALAALLHYVSRFLGAAEIFIIMRVLGTPATFLQAVFIAAGVTIINTAFFVVPGHVGVMESAHVVILQSLGFSAGLGLGLGVIRRLRKLATMAVGMVLLGLEKRKR